jgi:hypothetical protein
MMHSLGKLMLFAVTVLVYLLSWCLDTRCCYDFCSLLAVLAMLSFGNLVIWYYLLLLLPFTNRLGIVV